MYCYKCGTEFMEEYTYCHKCGAYLTDSIKISSAQFTTQSAADAPSAPVDIYTTVAPLIPVEQCATDTPAEPAGQYVNAAPSNLTTHYTDTAPVAPTDRHSTELPPIPTSKHTAYVVTEPDKQIIIDRSEHKYAVLGGWLLLFVVLDVIGTIYSIIKNINAYLSINKLADFIRIEGGEAMFTWLLVTTIHSTLIIFLESIFIIFVLSKNHNFFMLFIINYSVLIIGSLSIFISGSIIGIEAAAKASNYGTVLLSLIISIILFIYFVCSVRVATYMGSYDYIRRVPIKRLHDKIPYYGGIK